MGTENASREFPGEYRLDVEDFGPIGKASVDLRPLTVFIGPSSTGKSYLAILVYALHQCFGEGKTQLYGDRLPRLILDSFVNSEFTEETEEILGRFSDWLLLGSNRESQNNAYEDTDIQPDFPMQVDSRIRTVFEQVDGFSDYIANKICGYLGFGVEEIASLVRRSKDVSGARVKLSIPRLAGDGTVGYWIRINEEGVEFSGSIGGSEPIVNDIERSAVLRDTPLNLRYLRRSARQEVDNDDDLMISLTRIMAAAFKELTRPINRNAYYLPADRTGAMHTHKAVVRAVIQSAPFNTASLTADSPLFSGVLGDFLSELIGLDPIRTRARTRYRRVPAQLSDELATSLEHDVLKGAVRMEDAGSGYPTFEYRPDGWNQSLSLVQASSMVAELAPVVLYLRHLVRPEDVLIIEEPESNLHPAMQVEFTRQLAGLVRTGIRVIVTTHSEWVLQELANVVRASALPESKREGIAGGDVALDASQVGAWFFQPDLNGKGSTVSEIGLDEESGLYPTDFEEVARAMHNDWAEIFSRLGEVE